MKDLRRVEFAVALGRLRNFAAAARSIGVTQPTFSRGIAALEAELGVRLFDRSTRRVEPTPAGRMFLERAESLMANARWLRDGLQEHGSLQAGSLSIGVGPYPLEISVTEAVARLLGRHPQLQIRIYEGPWREFIERVLNGTAEIAVMEASVLATDLRFHVELMPRHRGCFFCRSDHPLARRGRLRIEDFDRYPAIGVPTVREVGPRLGKIRRRQSVDHLTGDLIPDVSVTSAATMREVVKRTDGIGLCAPSQLWQDLRTGSVVILETDFEPPSTGYGMAWLRGRTLSPAATAFLEILRGVEAELPGARPPSQSVQAQTRGRARRGQREATRRPRTG
jgi:DNA-binding transcriptional LysR family regulator